MAKSGDNFLTVDRLVAQGYDPLIYRYLTFNAHYRSELAFSWESLEGARRALARVQALRDRPEERTEQELIEATQEIEAAFFDDLNAPRALAALHQADSFALWRKFEPILGLDLDNLGLDESAKEITSEVTDLLEQREEARKTRDYVLADRLRAQIEGLGVRIGDAPEGAVVHPRRQ